jgi:hypothetical protein
VREADIARVCRIASDFRTRGARSLRELIDASGYRAIRPGLSIPVLARHLSAHPDVIEEWLGYASDKRTSWGWGIIEGDDDEGGWKVSERWPREGAPKERWHARVETACADYVLSEIDFWVAVEDARRAAER